MKIRIKVSIDATRRLSMNAFRWQRVCVCWWNVCEERESERKREKENVHMGERDREA